MKGKLSFRKFRAEDYDQLISLWKESGLPYRPLGRDSKESIEKEVQNDSTRFCLGLIDNRIIGSILITDDGRKGWINRLAVLPEYRCAGVGTELIKEAERRLIEKGLGIITSLIEDYNLSSRKLFRDLGYVEHKEIIYFAKRIKQNI